MPYTLAIGQLALAWNDLCERFGDLFWTIMGAGEMDRPIGVWNSQNFDRARREMLKAAALASSPSEIDKFPGIKNDIKWLCDRAEEFENRRNNAVHSPLLLNRNMLTVLMEFSDIVVPDDLRRNQRAINLAGKDLLSEFRWCRDSILVLRDFAALVDRALTAEGAPWPGRPSMPIPPQKTTRRKAQSRVLRRLSKLLVPPFPS